MGAELASPVTILVREPGRVTAGGGEPLVLSRGVKRLLQRVVHRAGQKRAQIPCLYLLHGGGEGVTTGHLLSISNAQNSFRLLLVFLCFAFLFLA